MISDQLAPRHDSVLRAHAKPGKQKPMSELFRKRLCTAFLAACTSALALVALPACHAANVQWPAITQQPTSRHVIGKWVWAELFSEDVKVAVRFYGEMFGWSFQAFPEARGPGYTLALSAGEPVGGMLERGERFKNERGSRWLGMISVPDVKAAARYASDHGGTVVMPPRFLSGRGEVALLTDPEGTPFGVIRSATGDPPDYLGEDRQWVWIELWARNPKAMAQFYSGVAGYEITPVDRPDGSLSYFLASGGYTRCAIIPSPAPDVASEWLPYLRVPDVKAAMKQVERAGGKVAVPPSAEIHNGRLAVILDPSGAPLGLVQLAEPEAR
jgi:predicted enzyme related to lactoylglutathione lyase